MPGHAYKGKGGQSPCQAERRPGVTCLGTERYHMNPDALDAYITGNYGATQHDPHEELLYGRMYTALTNYVNYVAPATSDDDQDDLDDLITEVLDKLIAGTDRN